MDYGKILSDAWKIVWEHKILWVFGILAGLGSGTGARGSSNVQRGVEYRTDSSDFNNLPPQLAQFFDSIARFIDQNAELLWLYLTLFILAILIISVISFFIRVYGQAGLVRGALLAQEKMNPEDEAPADEETTEDDPALADPVIKEEKLTFGQVHAEVKPYFWRLAGLRLVIFLAGLVIALVGIGILLLGTVVTLGFALLCFIPVICVMVPISWAVSVILKQAELALIVDDLSIKDALRRGYDVVRLNPGEYVIMALILFIGGGIVGFIFAIPQLLAMAPVFAAILTSAASEDWSNFLNGLWISLACLIGYWPVMLVLRGVLVSYLESSWLLTYLETSQSGIEPDDLPTIEAEVEPA